jgi:hypothetical protein
LMALKTHKGGYHVYKHGEHNNHPTVKSKWFWFLYYEVIFLFLRTAQIKTKRVYAGWESTEDISHTGRQWMAIPSNIPWFRPN